jgi:hypothetical protein
MQTNHQSNQRNQVQTTHEQGAQQLSSQPTSMLSAGVQTRGRGSGRRLAVVGIAAAAALLDWAILAPLAGITLDARQGSTQHVGVAAVLISTVLITLAGWGLLAILERRRPHTARATWTVVATSVCVLSLGGPLINGIGTGAKLGLASLHLVVGAVVILGLRRTVSDTEGS